MTQEEMLEQFDEMVASCPIVLSADKNNYCLVSIAELERLARFHVTIFALAQEVPANSKDEMTYMYATKTQESFDNLVLGSEAIISPEKVQELFPEIQPEN